MSVPAALIATTFFAVITVLTISGVTQIKNSKDNKELTSSQIKRNYVIGGIKITTAVLIAVSMTPLLLHTLSAMT